LLVGRENPIPGALIHEALGFVTPSARKIMPKPDDCSSLRQAPALPVHSGRLLLIAATFPQPACPADGSGPNGNLASCRRLTTQIDRQILPRKSPLNELT
jgi:hypothetical protein